ncbi:unnamed protein product, partial [marine sediment metagenome]
YFSGIGRPSFSKMSLEEAIKLASDPQSYYDYLCIVKFAIPRLIFEKLGLPMPLK